MLVLKDTFNLEDLEVLKQVTLTLTSSFQLEVMMIDVRCSSLSMDYGSLVEGLLSSFRPKKLLLPTDWDSQIVNKGMIYLLLDLRVRQIN